VPPQAAEALSFQVSSLQATGAGFRDCRRHVVAVANAGSYRPADTAGEKGRRTGAQMETADEHLRVG
jgi:hypothetical protein